LRVLIVDDDIDAATSLGYLLQLVGCKTAFAFGGDDAVQVSQLFQPALVFLDFDMPGDDGCAVLLKLRELSGQVSRAFIVCLTGQSDPERRQACIDIGFDRFECKPLDLLKMKTILDEARVRVAAVPATGVPADLAPDPAIG
jgi:CheY-like chemotaxis protein